VGVHTTGYDREFEPGRTHEATEQEYDLYLKHVESLETVSEGEKGKAGAKSAIRNRQSAITEED